MNLELKQMLTANILLDVFSIVLTFIPIIYLLSGRRYKQQINLYFLGVAVSNFFMILGDLSDWSFQNPAQLWQRHLLTAGSALYYAASAFVLYFFIQYIAAYIQLEGKRKKTVLLSVAVVCMVQVVFALLSPFTGFFFYITDTGYHCGSLFIISQLIPLFCYLLFTALIIVYRKKLTRREVVFFLLYIFIPLGCNGAQMFTRGIAVVNLGIVFALLLILVNIQFEHEMALQEQEKQLAEQRIDIMISQIQPHFLYNSLGTIDQLCAIDSEAAREAIRAFSKFLRSNMDSLKAREPIPFEKELDHVKNYLNLECRRFQDRLKVDYRIAVTDFCIPPLTLQPLVENAVRHGIFHKKDGGHIMISTMETEEYALLTVKDDGIGMEQSKEYLEFEEHAHIGISNVRSRIETMVGGAMEINSSDKGTTITMRIPWEGGI